MAPLPVPTDSDFDIEAQRAISQPPLVTQVPGQSQVKSNTTQGSRPMSTDDQNSGVTSKPQPVVLEDEGTQASGVNIRNDEGNNGTTMQGQDQIQTGPETTINTIIETHANDSPLQDPQDRDEVHMVCDFESSANTLWTMYGKEAKNHDEARILTLKDDMDGVLIFAGLFSAVLTAFALDSKQSLKSSPSDQMVYYLQQNVAMLDQISHQISSIAPQVSIPSTPPSPFPAFKPLASDIRVNVFWFMALIFSLSAALLAILVQQWVRAYMQAFTRYGDSLKSARLRQYLQEGCEGWYMPVAAEAVPALLHVSLFLFFVGLCVSILNVNTAVGVSTTVPIGIIGLVYIFTMIAPVIYPPSPYRNSFSGLIWYLIQKLHGRRFRDRDSNGTLKSLSSNMAQGQMELAMEETEARKGRDERSIRWLVSNMTEDAEIELLVMAIPGSFNGEWGIEVWKKILNSRSNQEPIAGPIADSDVVATNPLIVQPSRVNTVWSTFSSIIRQVRMRAGSDSLTNTAAPLPTSQTLDVPLNLASDDMQVDKVVQELSARIRHLLETCKNRGLFASDELWRQRTRACIETTASLVCCANAKLEWFGNIVKLLGDIGADQKIRELSSEEKDESFVMRWTCLSLMALRPLLERSDHVHYQARRALISLGREGPNGREQAQNIIENFDEARRCLDTLSELFQYGTTPSKEQVEMVLHSHELEISELERIDLEAEADWYNPESVDQSLVSGGILWFFEGSLHGIITRQLPGVRFDDLNLTRETNQTVAVEWCKNYFEFPIILPTQKLQSICSFASTFRNILQGDWDPGVYEETLNNLTEVVRAPLWQRNPVQRMLWRLQDLTYTRGFGFIVELFFLSLKQLLSTHSSANSYSALFIGTFRAITSDWSKYKNSLPTQRLLLDMIASNDGIVSSFDYPTYIRHEFLVLLGNVFAGQTGPHIDEAVSQLVKLYGWKYEEESKAFLAKALEILTRARRASSS